MNKKVVKAVAGSDRSKSLESDLIGDADRGVNQQELETGRRHVEEETKFQKPCDKGE